MAYLDKHENEILLTTKEKLKAILLAYFFWQMTIMGEVD